MTHYTPCTGCARKIGCTILADVRKAVAGHGKAMASIKVNCQKLYQQGMEPGIRVQVRDDRYTMSGKAWRYLLGEIGTILGWRKNGQAIVLFDNEELSFDDDTDSPMCRLQSVQHRDLDLIPEPKREMCGCGALIGLDGNPVTWPMRNNMGGGCQWGEGCLKGKS